MVRLSERERKEKEAKERKERRAQEKKERAEEERLAEERARREREEKERAERERRALLSELFCALEPPFVAPQPQPAKKGKKKKVLLDTPKEKGLGTPAGRYTAPTGRETSSAAQESKGLSNRHSRPERDSKSKAVSPQTSREVRNLC